MLVAAAALLALAPQTSLLEAFPPAEVADGAVLEWDGTRDGLFRLERFAIERDELRVVAGPSTLLVGGSPQGAVWAVVVPDDPGTVAGGLAGASEPLVHAYLRFHPGEVDELFPAETVDVCDEAWRLPAGYRVALAKLRSSWQASGRPVVPSRGTVVVDCGTGAAADTPGPGRRRFYMAEGGEPFAYYDAFAPQALPREVSVDPERALSALEEAWSAFDAEYAMFGLREVDWKARRGELAGWAAEVHTAWELALAVQRLVEPLDDRHAWVRVGDEFLVDGPGHKDHRANFQAVMNALEPMSQPRRGINWGRTPDGIGYVSVSALDGQDLVEHFDTALTRLADVSGLVVDLRFNAGGNEAFAQAMVGRFAARRTVYAKQRFRDGPAHDDLGEWYERVLEPRGERVELPVRVLIGPEVMSSAEAFALMFQALPGIELIGARTAGSSGNPRTLELDGGVICAVPQWLAARPDGTPIETNGVRPDQPVLAGPEAYRAADPTFEAALADLRRR